MHILSATNVKNNEEINSSMNPFYFFILFLCMFSVNIDVFGQENSTKNEHIVIVEKLNFLSDQSSNTTFFEILGLFVAVFTGVGIPILWDRKKSKSANKELLKKTSRSLLREVEHNRKSLSGEMGYSVVTRNIDGKHPNTKYTNAFLDNDSYDSVIASGQFIQFPVETQGLLREFYTRIKDHTSTLIYTNHQEDLIKRDLENNKSYSPEVLARYDEFLTRIDKEILELSPKVEKLLKNEIN